MEEADSEIFDEGSVKELSGEVGRGGLCKQLSRIEEQQTSRIGYSWVIIGLQGMLKRGDGCLVGLLAGDRGGVWPNMLIYLVLLESVCEGLQKGKGDSAQNGALVT